MHTDRDSYSSDDSGNSSDQSQVSGTGSHSGSEIEALALACDANGKVLCTCGCKRRRTPRTVFRHLNKVCLRRKLAQEQAGSIDMGVPDIMDDLRATVDNEEPVDQMDEAKDHDQDLPDIPMHYDSEGDIDDAASSRGSWYDISTPLPSPPPTPPQFSDDDLSPDEDGYRNIDAEDYRDYDRWFAEDRIDELNEMDIERLTEEEMDSIKMMAIRQFGHISIRNYERIRYSFRNKVHLLTLQVLGTRIKKLSGVKPDLYDCCVNTCHAFTLEYADEEVCSECGEPRFDEKGSPRQSYQYIPTIPRFRAMFNNPDLVQKLAYRHNYPQEAGDLSDYFDSESYKALCQRNIVIEGEDTGVRFFSGTYDIASSLMTDGVSVFKQFGSKNATCWPVMLQILNLAPTERAQLRNVLPLAIIPGPNQPKDFNSFLAPFVDECVKFARGVETYNVLTRRTFLLRHHPVMVCGDMQAIKHVEEMKGPNAVVPCRGCLSVGVYHHPKKKYYIPLAEPLDDDSPNGKTNSYNALKLPLRTEENLAAQLRRMERVKDFPGEYKELAKKYGITGPSVLDRIPSIQRPTSYPHEFLHLFLLNHGPNLVRLWAGTYSGIKDSGSEDYMLSNADWVAIGKETEAATYSLPAKFIRPIPNIESSWTKFCGETWSFWLIYIGPIVLRGRLPQKYYDHYLELVNILKCLLLLENTVERIQQLRLEIAGYVRRFEEYYYQDDYERLCVCKLTLHALLHVADDVIRCGPVWVSWSFSIERYCRDVTACARSKVVPYSTINKHVLHMAQISAAAMRFAEIRKALLFGKADAPVDVSPMEQIYNEYPDTILRKPLIRGFPLQKHVRQRVAAFLRTNNPGRTFSEWFQYTPARAERWGKVRIANGGDCIRSACVTNPLKAYGKRDSSYVRFKYQRDINERFRNKPVEMVQAVGYGRLDFILALTLPPNPRFDVEEPTLHILAQITEAKGAEGDASTGLVSYTELGRTFVLDITSVEHVVGRVETRGVRPAGEWVLVDRSDDYSRTVFQGEEQGYEEEEEE